MKGIEGKVGNIILSNSRSMVALRQGRPLFVRRLRQLDDPKRPEMEFLSVLVVAAEENPGEGFEELPDQSFLMIQRDLATNISKA